jgi:hypothetical protein
MKIKEETMINDNFTGIIEFCDGTHNPFWLCIQYVKNSNFYRKDGPTTVFFNKKKQEI